MAIAPPPSRSQRSLGLPSRRQRRRKRWLAALGLLVLGLLALAAAVLHWSGATLAADPVALARVDVQPFGGKLVRATASDPAGRPIPLSVVNGRLTPRIRLAQGERVSVDVVVRRPGWSAWALGRERRERLGLRTPTAGVTARWLTIRSGSTLRVAFDRPVTAVAYGIHARRALPRPPGGPAGGARGRGGCAGGRAGAGRGGAGWGARARRGPGGGSARASG